MPQSFQRARPGVRVGSTGCQRIPGCSFSFRQAGKPHIEGKQLHVVAKLAKAFERSSRPEQALSEFLRIGLEAVRADSGLLYLRREDRIVLYAARGFKGETIKTLSTVPLNTEEFLACDRPVIRDTSQPPLTLLKDEVKKVVICPLFLRGELTGATVYGYRTEITRYRLCQYVSLIVFLVRALAFAVENFQLLERLRKQDEQLRRIAAELVNIQEKERARLARELHDQISQALGAVKFNLEVLREGLGGEKLLKGPLEACLQLVAESMRELKRIIAGLRPVILEERGLREAIHWYLDTLSRTTGMAITYHCGNLPSSVPDQVAISLFRVVQEALGNIVKHSGATAVRVELQSDSSSISLNISDNGCGLSVGSGLGTPVFSRGMVGGIVGIRERATLLGGKFDLFSEPGKGTTVIVRIPLSES